MTAVSDRLFSPDRRKHHRFKVPADAFAIIKYPRFKVGQIMDLSMGGLALCYLDHRLTPGSVRGLDMLLADNGFYLSDIEATLMWDEPCYLFSREEPAPMRQCGMKFEKLTPRQQAKLTIFFPQHADGFAYERRRSAGGWI
ncbi:MAG: PilZ domain-containing protein [Thermodesulfobacteriota bacterium]